MRLLLLFLLSITSAFSFGQVSIDAGARKEVARFKSTSAVEYISPSFSNVYLNDSYFLKVNYEKKKWIFSTEVSSLNKALQISDSGSSSETDYIYGGGPPGGSNLTVKTKDGSWHYNSNLKLNYLGIRLGVDKSFFQHRFNFLFGASINCDYLINSTEDLDYLHTTIETTTNWNGTSSNTTINTTPFSEANNAVNEIYLNFGLNTAVRYKFKNCYIDAFLNNAFTWYQRYRNSHEFFPEYEEMTLFNAPYNLEYGIRFGYYLFTKKND